MRCVGAAPPRSRGRDRQRGTVALLGVGMAIGLLVIGGFAVDLWRAHGERRALAEMADAAAAAGANGLDVDRYRSTGELALDPAVAAQLARESLARQPDRGPFEPVTAVVADEQRVVVRVEGAVRPLLLGLFTGGDDLVVSVTAEAGPRRP